MRFPQNPMRFTKANVAALSIPPGKSELLVFDDAIPGFGLRLRSGGKRTWVAQYRLGTKQRRITLGSTETVDPDEARKRARSALAKVSLGADPQHEKAEARSQAALTLDAVADLYLTRRAKVRLKPRSFNEVERHLKRHWAPLAERAIGKLKRSDVSARLAEIAAENGPFASNRARAALSAMFGWAMGEGLADANPVTGSNRATEEISRDRVLSDAELRAIWLNAGTGHYGAIVRLLILTGQRREEIGGMLWSEVEGDLWAIGAARTKNRRPHDVPLAPLAMTVLEGLGRSKARNFVFGTREGPFQGWGAAKESLNQRATKALAEMKPTKKLPPWRLHDLRRTVATRMADLGVLPHVIEAVLNHVSGHKAGVAGVYNKSTYGTEKRAALELWGAHVERLTSSTTEPGP